MINKLSNVAMRIAGNKKPKRVFAQPELEEVSNEELIENMLDGDSGDDIDQGADSGFVDEGDPNVHSDGLEVATEYSCHMTFDIMASFEGKTPKAELAAKIKECLKNAIQAGMQEAANELALSSTEVKVLPINMKLSVLDESEISNGAEFDMDVGEEADYSEDEDPLEDGDDDEDGDSEDDGDEEDPDADDESGDESED